MSLKDLNFFHILHLHILFIQRDQSDHIARKTLCLAPGQPGFYLQHFITVLQGLNFGLLAQIKE